ncbi:hypothetical protein BTR22_13660 [Alkalihalophilus pseudofirmus]|uniref:AEC family transporter n=1 Tax=Alkalihalophilus pseudofirmus TaxID=79885 RepID=UPI000952D28F|nr:hypothetical protein BTR22_13660 [Alkalihalophilus pseudofirmus]
MTGSAFLFYEMLGLLVIGFIGFTARKVRILPVESNRVLTQVILYITLPSLILYAMDINLSTEIMFELLWLIGLSIYAMAVAILVGRGMRRSATLPENKQGVYEGLIVFGNQGFIGYAVTFYLFGEIGVLYTAIFMIFYLFLIWSYAIYLVARNYQKINLSLLFWNPGIIATTLGLVIMLLPFGWPSPVSSLLLTLGELTMPLSMLLIGSLLAGLTSSTCRQLMTSKYVWLAVLTKLVVIPVFLLPFIYLPVSMTVIGVAILVTATPSAPTITMYAEKYGGDTKFAAVIVAAGTILCVLTIPLLYSLIIWLS